MSLTCHISVCGFKMFSPFCQKEVMLCWNINTWHEVMACCSMVPASKTTSLCLVTQCEITPLMRGLINLNWRLCCHQTAFVSFGWKQDETIQPPFPVDRLWKGFLLFLPLTSLFHASCLLASSPSFLSSSASTSSVQRRGMRSEGTPLAETKSLNKGVLWEPVWLFFDLFCFVLFCFLCCGFHSRPRCRAENSGKLKDYRWGRHKVVTVFVCVSQ